MTTLSPINLARKLATLSEYWSPRVVTTLSSSSRAASSIPVTPVAR